MIHTPFSDISCALLRCLIALDPMVPGVGSTTTPALPLLDVGMTCTGDGTGATVGAGAGVGAGAATRCTPRSMSFPNADAKSM